MSAAGMCVWFNSDQTITYPMNKPASIRPGMTPAMKSCAIETSAATP